MVFWRIVGRTDCDAGALAGIGEGGEGSWHVAAADAGDGFLDVGGVGAAYALEVSGVRLRAATMLMSKLMREC
jgi:hypothetical protein